MKFNFFYSISSPAKELSMEVLGKLTRSERVKNLCKQIREAETDEEGAKSKKQLPAICWQGHFPEGQKRSNVNAESTGCVMLDCDHIGDARAEWQRIKEAAFAHYLLLAHITPSGEGLRLVFPIPLGMDIEEAQAYYTRRLKLKNVDTCVKDLARLSFVPEHSYWLYCSKAIFEGEIPVVEAEELPEGESEAAVTEKTEEGAVVAAQKDYPKEYRGIPYTTILEFLVDQLGGAPCEGDRNNFIYKAALHLRHICNDDAKWIASFLPTYGEEPKAWMRTIESACQAKKCPLLSRAMLAALRQAGIQQEQAEEDSPLPPKRPRRLPDVVWHLIKNSPIQCRDMVSQAVFPPLCAHLKGVKFTMVDEQEREPALMSIQMAPQSSGKGAVDAPIQCILEDIEARDAVNRQREDEWKRKVRKMGANKEKEERPTDLCVQVITSDITSAALNQKLLDADGSFLYTNMSELDMLFRMQGGSANAKNDTLIRAAYDCAKWGQMRVGAESVTAQVPLRFLFNASCTPHSSLPWLRTKLMDGTVSRLNFSTIFKSDAPFKYGRYDDQYKAKLKPYIDRLTSTQPGVYTCQEALELAGKLQKQYEELASLHDCEVLKAYTYRGVAIALWKGYILWLMNDKKWTQDIADFMEWSLDYDLWLKQYFFESALEKAVSQTLVDGRIKKNLLSLLPDTFTKEQLIEVRKAQGEPSEGLAKKTTDCLKQWKKRGFVVYNEETQKWEKTDKYKARIPDKKGDR